MSSNHTEQGFSLIEMVIVVTIIGILIGGAMNFLAGQTLKSKSSATKSQFEGIDLALSSYVDRYGRLPCPAPLLAQQDSPEFGVPTDCTDQKSVKPGECSEELGYCVQNGRVETIVIKEREVERPLRVRIGTLPVRDLNVPFEMVKDVWGNRIVYAVTEQLAASAQSYSDTEGGIYIIDTNGNSVITPPGTGSYVLVSHGVDSSGAHSFSSGALVSECPNADTADGENCDFDSMKAVFRAGFQSLASGPNRFDDNVKYKTKLTSASSGGPLTCKDMPICSMDNIDTASVCQIKGGSSGIPLCTHREDVKGGPDEDDEYEHDITTWRDACNWGDGWKLPNLAELRVLFKHKNDIGNFQDADYLTGSYFNPGIIENPDRKIKVWAKEFTPSGKFGSTGGGKEDSFSISPMNEDRGEVGYIRCVKR